MDMILIYIINHPQINRNTPLVNGAGRGEDVAPPAHTGGGVTPPR